MTPEEKYNHRIDQIDLSNIKGKNIFITGGTGFFGLWILRLLHLLNKKNYQIRATILSRNPDAFLTSHPELKASWLSWLKGDVGSYVHPSKKFDLLIHGAADTSQEGLNKPGIIFNTIVSGTQHVLQHATSSGINRVLIISSGAVYGDVSNDLPSIPEHHSTGPLTYESSNAYGEGKRAAEMLAICNAESYPVEVVIARCFAFMGEGLGKHLALYHLIRQAQEEHSIVISGSGKSRRSFLHGQDLAIWLFKLLLNGSASNVYNVGSDQSYTIKELAEVIRDKIAPEKEIIIKGTDKVEPRMNYIPSIDKARALGLEPWITLEEMLNDLK